MVLSVLTDISALYELAPYVGSVFQHPKSQFYTLLTDTEIVFACENLGLDRGDILSRFEKTVTALHLEKLLGKSLFALSGGEKQKIACASVCALMPDIFVLDEPTSNLDIGTIRDMQAILMDWKRQGKTIIIAEHRLAWLCGIADRVLYFQAGEIALDIAAERFWALPVDEFHRMGLRTFCEFSPAAKLGQIDSGNLELFGFRYEQKNEIILDIPQLSIPKGAIVAVLGNNGAGKTTFARSLCGLIKKPKEHFVLTAKSMPPNNAWACVTW